MTSHELAFQNFIDGVRTAGSDMALRAVAERATHQMGFSLFAFVGLGPEGPILLSNYDRAWTDRYFEQGYEDIDPVIVQARHKVVPFAWDGHAPDVLASSHRRRLFLQAEDFGIRAGVTIPIRCAFGRSASLTMSGGGRARDVERVLQDADDVLQMMAMYFHARVDMTLREGAASRAPSLSQRETECLAWSSRGKTMPEIAHILGVRPRTVSFHLENARVKLGASNVTHAVAICLRRRLLP